MSANNLRSTIEIKLLQKDENPLKTLLSIDVTNASAQDFFNELKKQTKGKVSFFYLASDLAQMKPITIKKKNVTIGQLLKEVLAPYPNLKYALNDNVIEITKQDVKVKKEFEVKGKVLDAESKKPIVGATIIVVGSNNGAISDNEGKFILNSVSENSKLDISFVGMKPLIYDKQLFAGEDIIVNMEVDAMVMDDVVVTGIFNRREEGFTGSTTKVTGKDIAKMTSGNALKALQMLDPGFKMNTSNISGSNPNAIADFNVRGKSSMGNYDDVEVQKLRGDYGSRPNQPLFVLDGIIGVDASVITNLDPAQIESITLLKDAAATVIYGSSASNGVVVVETKAPVAGKLRVSYNGNYSVQIPDLRDYNLCNSREKLRMEEMSGLFDDKNDLYQNEYYNHIKNEIDRGVDTYWLSQPVEVAFGHRHGVNLEGGDNSLRYKLYLGYSAAPGVMKETSLNTKSGKVDLRYRFGKFLISNMLSIDYDSGRRTSPYGDFSEYTSLNPYYRIYDEEGKILKDLGKFTNARDGIGNPMYNTTFQTKDDLKEFRLLESFKAEYIPMDNLRFSVDFTLGRKDVNVDVFKPAMHTDFINEIDPSKRGKYDKTNSDYFNYDLSASVAYNKTFNVDHLFSVYGRYSIKEETNNTSLLSMIGFPSDKLSEAYLGTGYDKISGDEDIRRSLGFMFTLNYSYKQKYAVDFSMRIDAASQFGEDSRFAPFWSAGLRWNAANEPFIKKMKIFDELTLRATYGITGSQDFSSYQSLQMYSYNGLTDYYKSSDVIGVALYGLGNPDLKWQQTDNYNVSIDFSILNNLISAKFEYYENYTKNTLLDYSIAPSTGFESIKNNLGSISNKGYEATLRIMPYSNYQKEAYWNIMLNAGHNKNRIEEISNAMKTLNEKNQRSSNRPTPQYQNGYSQTTIWAVKSLGIDPTSGREVFQNRDGSTTYDYDPKEQIAIADSEPKLQGTLSTSFAYKGFGVNLAARYSFGGYIHNSTLIDKIENANVENNVDRRALTERWVKSGDEAQYKAINRNVSTTPTHTSSRFVMESNDFMVSSINLSYDMNSERNKFLKKVGLSSASLGLYFEEVVRFSSIKMERGLAYPFAQRVSLSLNLTF